VEPDIEAVGIADRPDVEPRCHQCLLDRVGREVLVPEDQAGRPMKAVEGLRG
jgi:hypothetical protein